MNVQECPICMNPIDGENNKVKTECGHLFHCSCLMKNAAHNGFGCPYCREIMAEIPQESYDSDSDNDSDDDEEDDDVVYALTDKYWEDEALTSFRMFHQRLNGEDVEEDDEWNMNESSSVPKPSYEYVSEKLVSQGITFDDLVQIILCDDHSDINETYDDFYTKSYDIYTQIRNIITEYSRPSVNSETNLAQVSSNIPVLSLNIPYNNHNNIETPILTPQAPRTKDCSHQEIAEPKVRNIKRYEYML